MAQEDEDVKNCLTSPEKFSIPNIHFQIGSSYEFYYLGPYVQPELDSLFFCSRTQRKGKIKFIIRVEQTFLHSSIHFTHTRESPKNRYTESRAFH